MKNALIEICNRYRQNSKTAIVNEPYIPFIPEKWNGVLVLAESQNLSKTNNEYVNRLLSMSVLDRIQRLYQEPRTLGIQPWDDGSLKFAQKPALGLNSGETAVCNSVLWSQQNKNGANKNPSGQINQQSTIIWTEFLEIIKPKLIITAGKIAQTIILETKWKGKQLNLRLPSKMALSRISNMFDEQDLLNKYPDVKDAVTNYSGWIKTFRQNKIFYACHAVSINKNYKYEN